MSTQPYTASPDVFLLQIPAETPGIRMQQFESAWGPTDETLCFYNGILIGLAHQRDEQPEATISLLPKLLAQREYPWPTAEVFNDALHACLQAAPTWELRCEWDADQSKVSVLADAEALRKSIEAALAYAQGANTTCPTFFARRVA